LKGGLSIFTQVFVAFMFLAIFPVVIASLLVLSIYDELIAELGALAGGMDPVLSYSLMREASILVGITIVIAAVVSFFASLFLSKAMGMPLRQLLKAAQRVGRGDLDVRVQARSNDEFGLLGRGFNLMVRQLSHLTAELEKTNLNLEKRVGERTGELSLAYERLKRSSQKINEASRMKSEFLANVSHELRTPLSAILGFSELLIDNIYGELSDRQADVIRKMDKNARQLLDLINNVLDLSKIESGKMEVHARKFDLMEMIRSTTDSLHALFDRKGLLLIVRPEELIPEVEQDEGKLQQILINLLSNALKFTEKGSITLKIRRESDQKNLCIEVTDTGIGIPKEKLGTIFEQFVQVEGGTNREQGGTGLGLSLVQLLVGLLGGSISVESAVGQGSRFRVYFPILYEAPTKLETIPRRPLVPNVLAVDDEPETLNYLEEILPNAGFSLVRCLSGAEAAKIARETNPTAIFLDALMPGKDGWTVLKELQEDPMTKKIPVFMMDDTDIRTEAVLWGAQDSLTKPVSAESVLGLLWASAKPDTSRGDHTHDR